MMPWSDEDRRRVAAEPYRRREREAGRLPASGRPKDKISLERNQDYPADTDLCFGTGSYETRVRLTPADVHALRARLLGQCCDLSELKDRAAGYMRDALDEVGPDVEEWAARNMELAWTAHAAGYQLCAEDHRAANQDAGYVRDFLAGLLEGLRCGTDGLVLLEQADALERVIEMLRVRP
jgi:hypothetical protein